MKLEEKYSKSRFKRICLEIGNDFDNFQYIEIISKNNSLYIEYTPKKYTTSKLFSKKINVKHEIFFSELMKINIDHWDENYNPNIYSGHRWNLKLYFRPSIIVEKNGSNNYPHNFDELIALFRKYHSEFNVDTRIRSILNEKDLLKLYCSNFEGTSFSEVEIGDKNIFGENSYSRKLDIVRIKNDHYKWFRKYANNKEYFQRIVKKNHEIEIVEIKTKLNRPVIGQIIVGEYMFKKKFNTKNVAKTILYHKGDEALELFCKDNNIKLIKY